MSGIESLDLLTEQFARLPGIGRKTAQRLAFSVLRYSPEEIEAFTSAIKDAKEKIHHCPVCQNLTDRELCPICADAERDKSVICVVEDARAIFSLERVRDFKVKYHVLGGALSPMNGIGPDQLKIGELLKRIKEKEASEVIIATNPNVEGEATAIYLTRLLSPLGVKISRLAYGVPVGSDLEYTDEVTLSRALSGRREIDN